MENQHFPNVNVSAKFLLSAGQIDVCILRQRRSPSFMHALCVHTSQALPPSQRIAGKSVCTSNINIRLTPSLLDTKGLEKILKVIRCLLFLYYHPNSPHPHFSTTGLYRQMGRKRECVLFLQLYKYMSDRYMYITSIYIYLHNQT